jgi:hypothetical protein
MEIFTYFPDIFPGVHRIVKARLVISAGCIAPLEKVKESDSNRKQA